MDTQPVPSIAVCLFAAVVTAALWSSVFHLSVGWSVALGIGIAVVALIWRQGEASA